MIDETIATITIVASICLFMSVSMLVIISLGCMALEHYISKDCANPTGVAEVYEISDDRWSEIGGY